MPVTKDYMYWRGDVPFTVAPVSEADEFLICMMGMFDLRHVVPEDGTYISMRRAMELYLANGGDYMEPMTRCKRLFVDTQKYGNHVLDYVKRLQAQGKIIDATDEVRIELKK